jgi:hypothetical protein
VKRIGVAALAGVAMISAPAGSAAQWGPQVEAAATKDRISPEALERMAAGPMRVFKKSGLVPAQQAFEALLADTIRKRGTGSVEEADLLTAFGVAIDLIGIDRSDDNLQRAALPYLERAIPAYKAAFGPRHPEVALALNSSATLILNLHDRTLIGKAEAALAEAVAIRTEALGPDNSETKAAAATLERLRQQQAQPDEPTLAAAGSVLDQAANAAADAKTAASIGLPGARRTLWRPQYHYNPLIDEFVDGLGRLDPKDSTGRRAFAAKYGLTVATLNEATALLDDVAGAWFEDNRRPALRARALAWFKHSNRAPAALALTGGILNQISDTTCSAADVALLMKGSRNGEGDSWILATTCKDSASIATAIDRAGKSRAALLYLASTNFGADDASDLAAYDMLLRPDFLDQVDADQRDQVHANLAHNKLSKLISLGQLDQAVAFGDSLGPAIRQRALKPQKGEIRTTIGGFPFKDDVSTDSVAQDYAAALALAGWPADARAVLDLLAPRSKLKQVRACLDAARDKCDIGYDGVPLGALVVDQLLDDPSADPYVLLEAETWDTTGRYSGVAAATCRLLTRPDEARDCSEARTSAERDLRSVDKDDITLWSAIARAGGQPFEAARARYAAILPKPPAKDEDSRWSRASVDPAPVPFRELRTTPALLRKNALPNAAGLAGLPNGYALIRSERSGQRAIAISQSTRFDPNGEVSGGGYWIHLSDDGGKSWQPPLYLGLAEHFPYIVPAKSRLPLLAGDRLHLEVQEALIDTASISYPPVGLHVRRKRIGIYLDIALADLTKDSDGDGLTDIAARHLLLDAKGTAPTPFVAGQDRNCTAKPDTAAKLEILKALFNVEARALIEPPDKKAIFGGWRQIQPTGKPPIFLLGDPADWRCVVLDRPMIVYSEADRERLRKFSPDFQLTSLPEIRWNRAHTRGFVQWSMQWTGGTYRITRKGNGWELETISQWIT